MNVLCLVGLHRWEPYKQGDIDLTPVTRSWCPRCKADSILFGTYREVTRNVWNEETPADYQKRWDEMMERFTKAATR